MVSITPTTFIFTAERFFLTVVVRWSRGSRPLTDHLFEVAVEVNFSPEGEESWDDLSRALLLSVKALVGS